MIPAPEHFRHADLAAESIVRTVGKIIVLALPLGLGKACHIANALYACAEADRSIRLRIFTALTLEKPAAAHELERRFIEPIVARLFGGYPQLAYAHALRKGTMPPNIEVNEFFFLAGRWLSVPAAQQHYISANYSHAAGYVIDRGVNVVAQLVAARTVAGEARYSLSCNTDMTLDLMKARAAGKADFRLVGQVNSELPFMPGEGALTVDEFSHLLEGPDTEFPLFAPPKEPVSLTEHATGLHVARLVSDGGTLQIGIGQEGDALAHGLILRHTKNAAFCDIVGRLAQDAGPPAGQSLEPFAEGLYGVSEMFVDSFLALIAAGVLKREANGALLHAAFFLGPRDFYRALREMGETDLARLQMTAVSFTNEIYTDFEQKRAARTNARFVNSAMMATLLGAVVSDALEDGRVVSGVGGQYNFVSQAFALEGARSIITLKATRTARGRTTSNILWSYGHETLPRHLRDTIVTEYGIADLRGKSDRDVIAAMLAIADSRFQAGLLWQAKQASKIENDYELPLVHRQNTPDRIEAALAPSATVGLLPRYPFGTDFTEIEQRLVPALELIKAASASPVRLLALLARGLAAWSNSAGDAACLDRLQLAKPRTFSDHVNRALVVAALSAGAD